MKQYRELHDYKQVFEEQILEEFAVVNHLLELKKQQWVSMPKSKSENELVNQNKITYKITSKLK